MALRTTNPAGHIRPHAARVAGVNNRLWSLALNLAIGVTAAAAVDAIGALSTFALLTLPAMAALLATSSVWVTFATAAALSIVLPCLALVLSFYLDLPAGPTSVALARRSASLAAAVSGGRRREPESPGQGTPTAP